MNRLRLLLILASMPEQAFSFFVMWASGINAQYPLMMQEFGAEAKDSVFELRKTAVAYMDAAPRPTPATRVHRVDHATMLCWCGSSHGYGPESTRTQPVV